jgi:hypothetical protein
MLQEADGAKRTAADVAAIAIAQGFPLLASPLAAPTAPSSGGNGSGNGNGSGGGGNGSIGGGGGRAVSDPPEGVLSPAAAGARAAGGESEGEDVFSWAAGVLGGWRGGWVDGPYGQSDPSSSCSEEEGYAADVDSMWNSMDGVEGVADLKSDLDSVPISSGRSRGGGRKEGGGTATASDSIWDSIDGVDSTDGRL